MSVKEDKIVMYDSDEAAKQVTITGWQDRHGRFHGNNEHSARSLGATHHKCDCGEVIKIGYSKCDTCRHKQSVAAYEKMPFKGWDGVTPVVDWDGDKWFFNSDDIEEWAADNDMEKGEVVRLILGEPNRLCEVEFMALDDIMPEDFEVEQIVPKEIMDDFNALNKKIAAHKKPVSWSHGKFRTEYTIQGDDDETASS